jgi:hypothetical protein
MKKLRPLNNLPSESKLKKESQALSEKCWSFVMKRQRISSVTLKVKLSWTSSERFMSILLTDARKSLKKWQNSSSN